MQKHSIRQRIQRKERWCRKMEKKLAVIVDNKEITTEVTNTEMCSSACDVAMETCSSECHDTCGNVKIVSKLYAKIRSIEFEHLTGSDTIFLKSGKSKNGDGRNSVNNQDTMKQKSHMIIYKTEDGLTKIETTFDEDTVWLSIDQMAELFQRDKSTISRHIKNIFTEGELQRDSVVANFATTASDGKNYQVDYYNLDVIISVGYRVKSKRGTQFRIWATNILKEYMKKGFAMDDERLKNLGGGGYFKELLERIRDIRASEKVFYRQVLEIYATSIDYDPKAEISIQFFKKVQNKIHYAIHGQTAAEVIYTRADAEKEFMGLTTFAGNQPTLKEAVIAKNYLDEKELRAMGQLVSGYLDFAERQAEREQAMTMQDWAEHLDRILTMSGEKLLLGNGSISHKQAVDKATDEYKKYKARTLSDVEQDYFNSIKMLEQKTEKK